MAKTRVLIVDDSALMRQLLHEILASDAELEVVGLASDPYAARDKIKQLKPDVLTLDVEMPRMDGLSFLDKLMRYHPLPVVMVSSLTERGADTTIRALELGAVDFVAKPKVDLASGTVALGQELIRKVKTAAKARVGRRSTIDAPAANAATGPTGSATKSVPALGAIAANKVIAIGASTGGTEALRDFLQVLPADAPGIVIVQHMPEKFTKSFATRLDQLCQVAVKEAEDGDAILPGRVLLAPGNFHMTVQRRGTSFGVKVFASDPVNRHRPSVDVLFDSCAEQLGAAASGVILTGMGADGAKGLLAMRRAGSRTFAQDESTCVVFGMPKEAIALGAAEQVLPLQRLPAATLRALCEERTTV